MRRLWLLSILFLTPSVSGCGCTLELRQYLEPSMLMLTVGETATPPKISIYGCNLPRTVVEITRWESENPDVASVDAKTGVVTGVAPGETVINAFGTDTDVDTGKDYETYEATLPVTVVSPTTAAR